MTQISDQQSYNVYRKLNLTIISASNLPNVRTFFHNQIQATIGVAVNKKIKKKSSPIDKQNGLNPAWNYRVKYTFQESTILYDNIPVMIKLYSKRTLGDRYVGEVHVSLKELFDWAKGGSANFTFPVRRGGAMTAGVLNVSYSFGERFKKRGVWKKVFMGGACCLLRLTFLYSTGYDPSPN